MNSHPVDTECPGCGQRWIRREEEELRPKVGDVTICAGCGRVLRFVRSATGRGALKLAPLTARDERALRAALRERLQETG